MDRHGTSDVILAKAIRPYRARVPNSTGDTLIRALCVIHGDLTPNACLYTLDYFPSRRHACKSIYFIYSLYTRGRPSHIHNAGVSTRSCVLQTPGLRLTAGNKSRWRILSLISRTLTPGAMFPVYFNTKQNHLARRLPPTLGCSETRPRRHGRRSIVRRVSIQPGEA